MDWTKSILNVFFFLLLLIIHYFTICLYVHFIGNLKSNSDIMEEI